jgi:proton glutamate symport protein
MLTFMESLAETMFKFTGIVMYLAPLAVGAAMAYTVGHLGLGVLVALFKLLATSTRRSRSSSLRCSCRSRSRACAAATVRERGCGAGLDRVCDGELEAALPRAIEAMERFGVPRPDRRLRPPTGYSFNLDGSTLYLSLARCSSSRRVACRCPFTQQLVLLLALMLTSKGVAVCRVERS